VNCLRLVEFGVREFKWEVRWGWSLNMAIEREKRAFLPDGSTDRRVIESMIRALKVGGVVAYPTETVYGLGCDYMNEDGYRAILKLKQVKSKRPFILLLPNLVWLDELCPIAAGTRTVGALSRKFWPGPLTMILPASNKLPGFLVGIDGTLAVRVSSEPFVSDLLHTYGRPITSTSANTTGRPPASTSADIRLYFGDSKEVVALSVDGGVRSGAPSTVVRIESGRIIIEREGVISSGEILAACRP